MKTTWGYRIWQIVYPIGIYYVVSSLIYFALELLIGTAVETYMLRQLVCAACTIPVTLRFYQQDAVIRNTVYGKKQLKLDGAQIKNILCTLLAAAALGIAVNNIIAMTPLISASAGFQTANESFFGGTVVYELLGSCLMVPIAEELLFRGVVYQRLKGMMGAVPQAIVLSALIFGAVHFNLVQFLYATVLGCLLAYLYEKTEHFYIPVLGHIAANTIAVWRAETGALSFAYEPSAEGIGFTIVMLLITAGAVWIFHKSFSEKAE